MKWLKVGLLILCTMEMTSCQQAKSNEFTARVTFYRATGNKTSTGTKPKQGVTVAVDPKIIPYGSTIEIDELKGILDDGRFIAEDTGSAVRKRKAAKAAGEDVPVIDIYVSDKKYAKLKNDLPEFMKVRVIREKPAERAEKIEIRKEESKK